MKAWFKGGLIGGIIGVLFGIFLSFSIMSSGLSSGITGGGGGFSPIWFLAAIMWTPPITLIFFGIGSFIGWLIGKLKK